MLATLPWLFAGGGLLLVVAWWRVASSDHVGSAESAYCLLGVGAAVLLTFPGGLGRAAMGASALAAVGLALADHARPRSVAPPLPYTPAIVWGGIVLWLWLVTVDGLAGNLTSVKLITYLLAATQFALVLLLRLRGGVSAYWPVLVAMAVVSASHLVGIAQNTSWRPCNEGKCSVAGALYSGGYPSENLIALISLMGAAFLATLPSRPLRTATLGYFLLVIVATGSRTSLIAAAIGMAILAASWASSAAPRRRPATVPWVVAGGIALALVVAGFNLLVDARQDTLSNRGNIWMRALGAIGQDVWTGVGAGSWVPLQEIGVLPQHFSHSIYLYLYFSGGYIALGMLWFLATALIRSQVTGSWRLTIRSTIPPVVFLLAGLTEVVWNPVALDGLTWVFVGVAAFTLAGYRQDADDEDEPADVPRTAVAA